MTKNKTIRHLSVLLAATVLTACNATPRMEIPVVKQVEIKPVEPDEKLATIAFEKAVVTIRRGTVIAHFPGGEMGVDATLCNYQYPSNSFVEWGSGHRNFGGRDGEHAQVFYETMNAAGYSVVGDPKILFDRRRERSKAAYLIGARIKEIRGNLCEEHHWYDGRPLGRYAGEIYAKVEWSVFSNIREETVARFETEGFARRNKPLREGIGELYMSAFASAAEALTARKGFREILSLREREYDIDAGKRRFDTLYIPDLPLSRATVKRLLRKLITATVTINIGIGGHGSGFVVTDDGYILTNYHVVQDAKEVPVVFSNGVQVIGKVLRTDPQRDIALVRFNARGIRPFPIRLSPPLKVFDTVYAVGTPVERSLRATITKGIVSALRFYGKNNLRYIQSDVGISGGSSGGPLIDEFGNVVGVSVAGWGPDQYSAGLNLFIPIEDALTALNIEKRKKKKSEK